MKESKALKLGFNKINKGNTNDYYLIKEYLVFGFSKCIFSGKNIGYWIFNDENDCYVSIGSKETFEYLLTVEDAWNTAKELKYRINTVNKNKFCSYEK